MRNWVHFNDSRWPLVVFEAPLRFAPVQVSRFFADLDSCFQRREPFAVVLDLTPSSLPNPEVRRLLAEYYQKNLELARAYLVAEAVVVCSEPMKGLISSINQLASPQHPKELFANRGDAFRWARQLLSDAGYPPPEYQLRKSGLQFDRTSSWNIVPTMKKVGTDDKLR